MKTNSRVATKSSAYRLKIKSYIRRRYAVTLLSVAVFFVASLPAWATRTVTLKKTNESSCAGTLQVSGNGWGNWLPPEKPDKIEISVQNSSTLPVEGVIAHTTVTTETFSVSIHYSVVSPCSNDCSTSSTVKVTATGQKKGNTASNTINLPGLYCGLTWAPENQ
jgi:hypothetical protein